MPAVVISVVGMAWCAVPQGGAGVGAIMGTLVHGDIDCDAGQVVRGSAW